MARHLAGQSNFLCVREACVMEVLGQLFIGLAVFACAVRFYIDFGGADE